MRAWDKGKQVGQKNAFKLDEICSLVASLHSRLLYPKEVHHKPAKPSKY